MVPYSPDPKVINAVRSPLGMGALIATSLTMAFLLVLPTSLPWQFKAVVFGVMATGLASVWFCTMNSLKNVRIFVYGPRELLEQQRLEFEHNLAMRKLELEHRGK
jgi:hypothetical protein